jgi:hypothetical protein
MSVLAILSVPVESLQVVSPMYPSPFVHCHPLSVDLNVD